MATTEQCDHELLYDLVEANDLLAQLRADLRCGVSELLDLLALDRRDGLLVRRHVPVSFR
ncbi:hypothetical protein ACFL59_08590 [Planctomycetota bacterium]